MASVEGRRPRHRRVERIDTSLPEPDIGSGLDPTASQPSRWEVASTSFTRISGGALMVVIHEYLTRDLGCHLRKQSSPVEIPRESFHRPPRSGGSAHFSR